VRSQTQRRERTAERFVWSTRSKGAECVVSGSIRPRVLSRDLNGNVRPSGCESQPRETPLSASDAPPNNSHPGSHTRLHSKTIGFRNVRNTQGQLHRISNPRAVRVEGSWNILGKVREAEFSGLGGIAQMSVSGSNGIDNSSFPPDTGV
jgi:hypothetical protein